MKKLILSAFLLAGFLSNAQEAPKKDQNTQATEGPREVKKAPEVQSSQKSPQEAVTKQIEETKTKETKVERVPQKDTTQNANDAKKNEELKKSPTK